MKSKTAPQQAPARKRVELDDRYGDIGIPAVAAAVRYATEARNPAYAPVAHRTDQRVEDTAA